MLCWKISNHRPPEAARQLQIIVTTSGHLKSDYIVGNLSSVRKLTLNKYSVSYKI